jgi:hypothetical protein
MCTCAWWQSQFINSLRHWTLISIIISTGCTKWNINIILWQQQEWMIYSSLKYTYFQNDFCVICHISLATAIYQWHKFTTHPKAKKKSKKEEENNGEEEEKEEKEWRRKENKMTVIGSCLLRLLLNKNIIWCTLKQSNATSHWIQMSSNIYEDRQWTLW